MIARAFGESPLWSVGVEEELMLVDERTFELVPAAAQMLEHAEGVVKAELFTTMIETTTGICTSPADALEEMRRGRAAAAALAEREGLRVLACGSHPFSRPEDQPITAVPYYLDFVQFAGPAARRQGVCGLHVHVGMPDAETCVRALDAVLPWLPVVLALSANSPYLRGEQTGLLSTRAEVLATLPRASDPPPFASYAEWEALMERWLRAGLITRYTNVWWDARIHPAFGTLELRIPDQPTDIEVAGALVTTLHTLAVRAAEGSLRGGSRDDYRTNRFSASRFGPRAELVWGDRLVPVRELAAELEWPFDPERCEADRQLEHQGDLASLAADLASRT